jgi:hypothetical protein
VPARSLCPSMALPMVLEVQFSQVMSLPGGNALPSGCEPVGNAQTLFSAISLGVGDHANGPLALPWPIIADDHKDEAHLKTAQSTTAV